MRLRRSGAPAGSRWLKIGAERWTANASEIVCWLTLYAHVRFAQTLKDLGQSADPVYTIIEARTGERVIEAVQEDVGLRDAKRGRRQTEEKEGRSGH